MFFLSCQVEPLLKEDEHLIARNKVEVIQDAKDEYKVPIKEKELRPILKPKANPKFLGTYSSQYIYLKQRARTDTTKFNSWFAKQFGSEPRFVDSVVMDRSINSIENYLFNNGYFSGTASYEVEEKSPAFSIIKYQAYPKHQHRYGNYHINVPDSSLYQDLMEGININEHIIAGNAFRVDDLNAVRDQMMNNSQEKGYYHFSKSYIYATIDTLDTKADVADIYIDVDGQEDSLYNRKFYIRNIYMSLGQGISDNYSEPVEYNNKFYSNSKVVRVRPSVLDRFILMQKGDLFSKSKYSNTINKLYDLPIIKYANIEFQEIEDSTNQPVSNGDSMYLDVFIDANAKKLMNPRVEFTVSQFQGPAIGLEGNFTHRNIFKGGEVFNFGISGGLESISNAQEENQLFGNRIFEIKPEFIFPRLLLLENIFKNTYYSTTNQRTTIGAAYNSRDQVDLFTLRGLGVNAIWEFQSSPNNKHTIGFIDITRLRNITYPFYDSIIQNQPSIQYSLQNRLIMGSNYTYNYTNSKKRESTQNWLNFSGTVDFSGNLINLLSPGDSVVIWNLPVSQYARALTDLSFYQPFRERVSWVNHIRGGVAYPLGSIKSIPAVKQFYLGGSTSMRGWRPRSLGPGVYEIPNLQPDENVDQRGDVMLEFNSEFRFPVTKLFSLPLNGAIFGDVGNIWTLYEDELVGGREGTDFDFNSFYTELGFSAGAGLRLDIQNFLVVRTDFAWKIRDPSLPVDQRWIESPFSWDQMNFIFGLGYPFQ